MELADLYIAVGERCRQLRIDKGVSQEAFANLIEMDRTYYSSIELGKRNLTLKNLTKLAKGYDITVSELLDGIA